MPVISGSRSLSLLRRAAPWAAALVALWCATPQASRPPWARSSGPEPPYPEIWISAAEARRLGSQAQFADARPRASYERGRIPGAISLDPTTLPRRPGQLAGALGKAGLASDRTVVCYADGPNPVALGELFWLLEVAGLQRVRVLQGGVEAWRAAGGPLEAPTGAASPARFTARPDTSRFGDLAFVNQVYGQEGFVILESRSAGEWEQGHIPHALAFPMDSLRIRRGGLRDPRGLRAAFAGFGPRDQDYVNLADEFVICMERGRTGDPPLYLAARLAGLPRVRGVDAGFGAWRAAAKPVVRIVEAEEVRAKIGGATWVDKVRGKRVVKALLFDVRGQRDFDSGHLPGAVALPSHRFAEEFEGVVRERWPDLDRATTPIIFYCYGPSCIRSRHCASIAARHGYANLLWFRDGIEGWYAAGETLVTGP